MNGCMESQEVWAVEEKGFSCIQLPAITCFPTLIVLLSVTLLVLNLLLYLILGLWGQVLEEVGRKVV